MKTVTQWFVQSKRPKHAGEYEVRNSRFGGRFMTPANSGRRYFNGRRWQITAGGAPSNFGSFPDDQWRGLANKPRKS